jgi:hypothetical protein
MNILQRRRQLASGGGAQAIVDALFIGLVV